MAYVGQRRFRQAARLCSCARRWFGRVLACRWSGVLRAWSALLWAASFTPDQPPAGGGSARLSLGVVGPDYSELGGPGGGEHLRLERRGLDGVGPAEVDRERLPACVAGQRLRGPAVPAVE